MESLSEWLNTPKPRAHILHRDGLHLVHDLYHPWLCGHLALIGFGLRYKKNIVSGEKQLEEKYYGI